jgi:Mg2+ and Co2+ transporter CorA
MSLDIAKDTRKLAVESKRDSASMKTIAIVSMVFLPWTFLATFFTMPMFDWNMPAGKNVSSRSFWVYWTAAGPLTLLVLAIWQAGLLYKKRIEKKQDTKAMSDLKSGHSSP